MSELALTLIAENKKLRSPFLDLGNCGLTEVPLEIGELVWLEELSFANHWTYFDSKERVTKDTQNTGPQNNIARLAIRLPWFDWPVIFSPFSGLIKLKKLYLNGGLNESMAFNDLSPLSGLANLQGLDVSNTQVTDLSALSGLANLQVLNVWKTQVSDLSPLSSLENLQQLDVSETQVTDLSQLSGIANLQQLRVWKTQVSDLSPLSSLENLLRLDVSETQVTDLSQLSGIANLQQLDVWSTQVTDLSPLSGLANLQKIIVSETQVNDLSPLSGLAKLQQLDVSNTQVTDLSALSGLANLQVLNVWKTQVSDLSPLSCLAKLQQLDVSNTHVIDLSALSGLANLQVLNVWKTQVSDLSPLSSLVKLQGLDVSSTPVTDLSPLSGQANLQFLVVLSTPVTDLSPLSGLANLHELIVSETQVIDLSPLSGLANLQKLIVSETQVIDLSPLSSLLNLQVLNVSNTPVSDLSPLSGLAKLQFLVVSSTPVSDLSPLSSLTNLHELDVSSTPVTDLSPLSGLANLQKLIVSETQVIDLSPLSGLANLRQLDVLNTQVTDLSPLLQLIEKLLPVTYDFVVHGGISVWNCPLANPPAEIVKQGNAAILNFFHEKAIQGTNHLYEAKVLIIGEGGAGKTSLLRRLYYKTGTPLPDENETTKGIDIYRHEFKLANGRNFRLNVWDFGGQEIYHATHQFFFTKRSLYVLLDDTCKDYKTVHDTGFKYWLEVADLLGGHSPVLIFQNEKGGRRKTIDESGIKAKFNNVKEVYRGNLEQPGAADSLRRAVEFYAQNLPHIGEELPAHWVPIRSDIEQQAKDKPFISLQDYFAIYRNHLEFDRDKALHLSRYLHDVGVFLHFQDEPLLSRTVILQNTWATEAVFKMLDDETVKGKLGHFESTDCKRVWQDSMYADMHLELLALMQKFELCYRLPDTPCDAWLAPQLLPPSKPAVLTDWQQPGDLTLRYRYEFLPKGIVSRLIVRMHRFVIRPELSWISGALFERGGTQVLAEVPAKGGEIVLRARGPERKELLSVISADLDALNDSFHGLKDLITKWVPCHCSRCRKLTEPEFFEQERLLKRKHDGKLKVECPASYEDVDVLELLDGIRVDQLPGWAKDENTSKPLLQESENKIRTIKIFLASSSELKEDRDAFDLYFRQQNDRLRKQGIYLEIVRWENFLDAISETRLQDEYNKEVKACDVFVSLFLTKTGKFTEEEFDVAHRQFLQTGKPHIYTFFKNADIKTVNMPKQDLQSMWNFQERLSNLGHFYTSYDHIEHLKRQFNDQLEKLREKGI